MKKHLLPILFTGLLSIISSMSWAQVVFLVQQPSNLAGSYDFTYSSSNGWGADMDTVAITAQAAFALDGNSADSLACDAVVNSQDINGKIAVLYRGACNFSLKAQNVQDSGAVACVIINNVPGGPVGMGGGTSSAGVTIPVVMISDVDGATLRDSILAGAVTIFLGNNTGLFANNVGSYKPNIGMANSFAIPSQFAMTSTDFSVPIGTWVHNYGSAEAADITVNAVIDLDGTEVYNETSTGQNIPIGDSLFVSLPLFSQEGYDAGYYTITYTLAGTNSDEFPDDNVATAGFWINDSMYSKSRIDPANGTPMGSNGLRPANSVEFQWCTAMESENASAMEITSVSFNTITNSDVALTGEAVQIAVYKWNDPISSTSVTFTDLNEATDNEFYDYPTDSLAAAALQGEFVTHTLAQPIELLDNQKYLTCVTIFTDNMFLGVDQGLDYSTEYETYPDEVFFPLNDIDGGTWYAGGFGTDNVPSIITNLQLVNGIADDVQNRDVKPFPNPASEMINIPFGAELEGTVGLDVYDVEGKLVMTEDLCLKGSSTLRLDVSSLKSGLHTFNLTFEDNSKASFKVVLTK